MGRFVPARWPADLTAAGPRRARLGGTYLAYVPDPLVGRVTLVDLRVAADVADAEAALTRLDAAGTRVQGADRFEVLARLLLRAEAVGSSQIEGLVVSPRKLALAAFDPSGDPSGRAVEVLGNIDALRDALAAADRPGPITVADLCAIHRALLAPTRDAALGGVVRSEQNWIGGSSPLDAVFVPPPPTEVPALLEDLCAYLSADTHSPLVQAALVHAQFETLHPFADGNGRAGRALLHLVLRRRGLCRRFVAPISLMLATWSRRYVDALMATRAESPAACWEGEQAWVELFAEATRAACARVEGYARGMDALVAGWRSALTATCGPIRTDAAAWALIDQLPAAPLVTARTAVALTGRSARAIDGAIAQLVQAGVLRQVSGRLRHRTYEAVGVFEWVTRLERALATPSGDTRVEKPARAVPSRT